MSWGAVAIVLGVLGAGVLLDRLWRDRRKQTLPWTSDDALRGTCPTGTDADAWVSARRRLGELLRVEAERLAPDMRLDQLDSHFRLMGISSIDIAGVVDEELQHVPKAHLAGMVTVGDLIALIAEAN